MSLPETNIHSSIHTTFSRAKKVTLVLKYLGGILALKTKNPQKLLLLLKRNIACFKSSGNYITASKC